MKKQNHAFAHSIPLPLSQHSLKYLCIKKQALLFWMPKSLTTPNKSYPLYSFLTKDVLPHFLLSDKVVDCELQSMVEFSCTYSVNNLSFENKSPLQFECYSGIFHYIFLPPKCLETIILDFKANFGKRHLFYRVPI